MRQTFVLTRFARSVKAGEDGSERVELNVSSVVKLINRMSTAVVVDSSVKTGRGKVHK